MYKVSQIMFLPILFLYFASLLLLGHIFHMLQPFEFFSWHEISIIRDVAVKMYYEEFPLEANHSHTS